MRMAGGIKPCRFLDANCFDNQCVPVPFADRISEPRRLAIIRQRPPVRENLPVVVIRLIQNRDEAGLLNDLSRSLVSIRIRHTVWKTASVRPVFAVVCLAFVEE